MIVTDSKLIQDYYTALVNRDSQYVGTFFVGVKTTGIFCISTCRARKPKAKNVEFFKDVKGVMDAGYRPCKVCKPTENAEEAPESVKKAIDWVKNSPKEKISDYQLKSAGIQPEQVRRWFNQHYGMTFHAYQRMYRINLAYQELKGGQTSTLAAVDSGYDSLSGFGYTFKKHTGHSPSQASGHRLILIDRLTTPIGPMFVCATETGICLLEFVDRPMLESEFKDLQKRLKASIVTGENQHTKQLKQELREYFQGSRQVFSVKLDTPGTEFQQLVWEHLQKIPCGELSTYQQQAIRIDKPTAVRAVASANGFNRIAIVIPCHRVIGKNGKLTGYGGGLERKQWLIDHEHSMTDIKAASN